MQEDETPADRRDGMLERLTAQRDAFARDLPASLQTRRDRLDRAIALLVDHCTELTDAVRDDFGVRSDHETRFIDLGASIGSLKHARKRVARWMRPERRRAEFPLNLLGAKARVEHQALGVVGVVSPWNVPLNLTFSPLAGILAAGNRCMIKPSEFTPATSALLGQLIADYFDPTEVCVTTGGAEVGAAFCSLPFDHLLFTGAASIAKHVVRATAENLVPVTLELGGKCPVIIGRSVDLARAADSILAGKMLNSGQTCIAPDHVFVPENRTTEFTDVLRNAANRMFPTMLTNPDYGAIINQQHFRRLEAVLADAERGGSRLIALHPEQEDFDKQVSREKKFPPTLIVEPDKDSLAMQDEIFGPILPIISYGDLDQVIGSISSMPHPLALYYFGNDSAEQKSVLDRTCSGGFSVNDVMLHVAQEDLPFGGVGQSGTGAYHGHDGFLRFSHKRAVFTQSKLDVAKIAGLRPPYGRKLDKLIGRTIRK